MPRAVLRIPDDHAYWRQDWATGVNDVADAGKRTTVEYRMQNGAGDHFVVNRACYLYGLAALFRQRFNEYLTHERFAADWGLSEEFAAQLIELGRREHEAFVPHFKALWAENRRAG